MEIPLPSGTLAVLALQGLSVVNDVLHVMLRGNRDPAIRLILPEPLDGHCAVSTEVPPAHASIKAKNASTSEFNCAAACNSLIAVSMLPKPPSNFPPVSPESTTADVPMVIGI